MRKSRRYIIVDDDRTNNLICEYVVRGYDPSANILTFSEPELALISLKNSLKAQNSDPITVLFIDVNMPTMSGWEFLRNLEKITDALEKLQVYILSSSIEDFANEKEMYPYVRGFLSKPLTKARLENLEAG